ncbi:uncharacterized protein FIESC28_02530 [Fusarium coffeatum]|uniref:Uncharacterized protein n=1 Tax=Fusarium coffeatum TaxID=231269 RepID=A0A366S5I2_9HYPO|nr:uncharacterized protein FIESC28_02530 [Fusarium coffeatum]RBR24597.1 hypothetical protein FIESC28_02530 [Fusarium coffeatum]
MPTLRPNTTRSRVPKLNQDGIPMEYLQRRGEKFARGTIFQKHDGLGVAVWAVALGICVCVIGGLAAGNKKYEEKKAKEQEVEEGQEYYKKTYP